MSGCMILCGGLYEIDPTVQMPELQTFDIDKERRFHKRDRIGIMRWLRQECLCHRRSSIEWVKRKWGAPFLILEVRIWIIIQKKEIKMKIQKKMKTCDASCGEALEQSERMELRYTRVKIWGSFFLNSSKIRIFPDKTADLTSLNIDVRVLCCAT